MKIYLLRHGETEWSLSGRHTGTTDVPLTPQGEEEAKRLRPVLENIQFECVLTSPRLRARKTCELAGLGQTAQVLDDLHEWDYGDYEGLLFKEITAKHPGWDIFEYGCPNGETPEQVAARAERVLDPLRKLNGNIALFSHGHFTRALALGWSGVPLGYGGSLGSSTGSINILGFDGTDWPVIQRWNEKPGL